MQGTRDIKCPFFRSHIAEETNGKVDAEIRCEGIMEGCTHALVFDSRERKVTFQHIYCEEHYEKCEYYRMLMQEKYPDE